MKIDKKDLELALEEIRRNYGDVKIQFSEDGLEGVAGGKKALNRISATALASLSAMFSTGISSANFNTSSTLDRSLPVNKFKGKLKNLNLNNFKKVVLPIAIGGVGSVAIGLPVIAVVYKLKHSKSPGEFARVMQEARKEVKTRNDLLYVFAETKNSIAERVSNSNSRQSLNARLDDMIYEVQHTDNFDPSDCINYLTDVENGVRRAVYSKTSAQTPVSRPSESHVTASDITFLLELGNRGIDVRDILTVANVPCDPIMAFVITRLLSSVHQTYNSSDGISACINVVENWLDTFLVSDELRQRALELIQHILPDAVYASNFDDLVESAMNSRLRSVSSTNAPPALTPVQPARTCPQQSPDQQRDTLLNAFRDSSSMACFGADDDAWDILSDVDQGQQQNCVDKFVSSFNFINLFAADDPAVESRLLLNRRFLNMRHILDWRNISLETIMQNIGRSESGLKEWSDQMFRQWFGHIKGFRLDRSGDEEMREGSLVADFFNNQYDTMRYSDRSAYMTYIRFLYGFNNLADNAGFGDSAVFQTIHQHRLDKRGGDPDCEAYTNLLPEQKKVYDLWEFLCNSLSQTVTNYCYNQVCNQVSNAASILDSFYDDSNTEDDVLSSFSTSLFSDFADKSMNYLICSDRSNAYNAEREKSIKYILRSLVNVTPNTSVYSNYDNRYSLNSCFKTDVLANKCQTITAELARNLTFKSLYDYVNGYSRNFQHWFQIRTIEAVRRQQLGTPELNALDAMSGGELKKQLLDFITEYYRACRAGSDVSDSVLAAIQPLESWCDGGEITLEDLRPFYDLVVTEYDDFFNFEDGTNFQDNLGTRFKDIRDFIINLVPSLDPPTGNIVLGSTNFSAIFILNLLDRGLIDCTGF